MKKGCIWVMAVILAVGCVDRSYGGMEDEEIFDDMTEPIPVKIHIGAAETIVPKGSGVIGDVTEWKGEKFFVYAFGNDMLATYDVTSKADGSRCLIDGSKDVPGTLAGKQAYMMETSNVVAWSGPDERVYYPFGSESGIVYDFFAYYLDDIQVQEMDITRLQEKIMIRVEIDGSQDLMSSKARVLADQLAGFDDEQERLYMENYCYSYYAARKGIDPVFVFKHHLTKLDFMVTPAYNANGKRTVTVDRIEVKSKYRAQFTVADRGSSDNLGLLFDDDDYARLALKDVGPDGQMLDGLEEGRYAITTLDASQDRGTPISVGTSLLLAPDEEYTGYAYLTETYPDGNVHEYPEPLELVLRNPGGFLPGNGYTVNISVYGATRVEVDIMLAPWNDGGKIEVDDEDAFGNY